VLIIRRALGPDVLTSRGDEELRLNTNLVWSDAGEYVSTLRTLEFDRVIELYRGTLLQGFTLEAAPAFQEWLDTTRRYFAREAVKLALRSAELLSQANARTQAGDVTQFLLRVEPDLEDEHQLRKLLMVLDGLGDRIGAMRLYERFSQRVWKEFRITPAKETRELVEQLKRQ
jgi:DNA-binding SARP family transcriptional activator